MPPTILDVFRTDAFSCISLTDAVNRQEYVPGYLGSLPGLFEHKPIATTKVAVEARDDVLTLVPNTPRGADPDLGSQAGRKRVLRTFSLLHLPKRDQVQAEEIQDVRAFGSESQLQVIQQVVNDRLSQLQRDIDLTIENLMLGCVRGTILDADGSTVYNLFTEFGVSQESEIDFDLDNASPASGVLRTTCTGARRAVMRNCKGAPNSTQLYAICGDTFWDQFIAHPEVRETYKYTAAAADLRGGAAWETFTFGGITWTNYRGTDENTKLLVVAEKCHIFPVGVPGLFRLYYGPANFFPAVNTLGLPFYASQVVEPHQRWVDILVQSNPLPICTQPKVLVKGRNT